MLLCLALELDSYPTVHQPD